MRKIAIALAVTAALCRPGIAADPPPALVMAVKGDTDPKLSEMSEIPADTPVKLAAGAELTFLHYQRCKLVTVVGGTLRASRADYVSDGRIASEKEGPCPRVLALNDPAVSGRNTGGVVMRGIGAPPGPGAAPAQRWAVNAAFLLTGPAGGKVTAAAIYADERRDRPLARLDMAGRRATLPGNAPPILANSRYLLQLILSDRAAPVDIVFVGTVPAGPDSLVVLRVE